jgi:hypothetical protein
LARTPLGAVRRKCQRRAEGCPRLIPVKERGNDGKRWVSLRRKRSAQSRCSALTCTLWSRLLIRRFGVQVPGGPPQTYCSDAHRTSTRWIVGRPLGPNLRRKDSPQLTRADRPAIRERRAAFVHHADPLLVVEPDIAVGDHGAPLYELVLGAKDQPGRVGRRLASGDVSDRAPRCRSGPASVKPRPRPTNRSPDEDFRTRRRRRRAAGAVRGRPAELRGFTGRPVAGSARADFPPIS